MSFALCGCSPSSPDKTWDIFTQAEKDTTNISTITLNIDGDKVLTATKQNQIYLTNLKTSVRSKVFDDASSNHNNIFLTKFSPNSQYAISGSKALGTDQTEQQESSTLRASTFAIWDLSTLKPVGLWSLSDDADILDIAISDDGKSALIGTQDKMVDKAIFIDFKTGKRIEFLSNTPVRSVKLSANGQYALTVGNNLALIKEKDLGNTKMNFAYLWRTKDAQIIYKFEQDTPITLIALNDKYAFTSDYLGNAYIWDLKTGNKISNLQAKDRYQTFSRANFSKDGSFLVTGSFSGKINVWRSSNGERLKTWKISPGTVTISGPVTDVMSVVFASNKTTDDSVVATNANGLVESWMLDL